MDEEASLHRGHRQRMRDKFFTHGSQVMHSHELLEMLLFYTVQYKNTNDIAKRLLERFGSLEGVFSASREELSAVEGVGLKIADYLVRVGEFFHGSSPSHHAQIKLDSYTLAGEFLVGKLLGERSYKTVFLLLDNKMCLLEYVEMYSDDYASARVRASEMVDLAVGRHASVVITAHNHPFGPAFPTTGDMATQSAVNDAFKAVGIMHLEHYIVCGSKYMGLNKHYSLALAQFVAYSEFFGGGKNV